MAIIVNAPLDDRFVAEAVSSRCLLGVLVHQLFSPLSGSTHAALLLDWLRWLLNWIVMGFLSCSHGSVRRREAGADGLDHLREPEQVEQVQSDVGSQVGSA